MRSLYILLLGVVASWRLVTPCLAADAGATPTTPGTATAETAAPPADPYDNCYTPAELAALDKALWTQNMTRADLDFDKDFAKGYECFPVVREMMQDPLEIGPALDKFSHEALTPSHGNGQERADTKGVLYFNHEVFGLPGLQASIQVPAVSIPGLNAAQNEAVTTLARMEANVSAGSDQTTLAALRDQLEVAMTWHAVDGIEPPKQVDKSVFEAASKADLITHAMGAYADWFPLDDSLFPQDRPLIVDTQYGRVCFGTKNDDTYSGDFALLVDPGGNDTYHNCRIGGAYGKRTHTARLDLTGEPTGASADYSPLGDGQVGFFIDMGGNDLYDCADVDVTLGAAVMGYGFFEDLGGGNDRYYGGNVSLGAAIGGVATFYDDGGSDTYSGKVYTQGAAGFGIAVMCDDSVAPAPVIPSDVETPDPIDMRALDNDTYDAWSEAQGFARTRGVAICTNARGNETYHAGGVYLDAPLFTDRYESLSQGMAIGERDIDYAGGIALLADYGGNDRYLGDVYDQGVGYWYSAGFLYDGGGNDTYEMTQYGQGSGIHLAVGGLIDESGSDTYVMHNGLGQGGSHDYAASLFMDRGGDDRYLGNTSCNGTGLTNSVALFFDRSGNDVYAGKRGSLNVGRPARGFGSIGVLVDLGGTDDYLGQMHDDALWTTPQYGVGLDVGDVFGPLVGIAPPDKREGVEANAGGFDKPSAGLQMPDILSYSGPLTQDVFDKLWELAIRWEVGDNRVIVPAARKKLVAFGPDVLPLVAARMGDIDDGLAQRAQEDVFKGIIDAATPKDGGTGVPAGGNSSNTQTVPSSATGATPAPPIIPKAVIDILTTQLNSGEDQRVRNALVMIGDLKLTDMGPALATMVDSPDPALRRRAVSVLGQIGSHAADDKLLGILRDRNADEKLLKVAVEAATSLLGENCFGDLLQISNHPSYAVRDTLEHCLAAHMDVFAPEMKNIFTVFFAAASGNNTRRARTLLRAYADSDVVPDAELIKALSHYADIKDDGIQLETSRLAAHWKPLVEKRPQLKHRLADVQRKLKPLATDAVLDIRSPS